MKPNRLSGLFLGLFISTFTGVSAQTATAALLHEAAKEGDLEQVNKLIEGVENVNAKDDHGRTALHYAAMIGHKGIVKVLIARGAEINLKNDYGIAPLTEAIDGAYPMEAGTNHDGVIKLLVANGADVTAKGEFGMTALHWAVNTWQKDFAEQLIAKGAEVDAKDESGRTPLYTASRDGNVSFVELLVSEGAVVNIQDEYGNTPLHNAAFSGHREVVVLLVANGADITTKNRSGHTPLHDAAWDGHTDVVEFIIAKGANVHSLDKDEQTPLHLAAGHGEKNTSEFLIAKGADINARNRYGTTPLGLAVGGHRSIRELPEAKDADGYYKRADHFHGENKLDRAIEDYTSSARLNPEQDLVYFSRGRAWAKKGSPQKAIDDWEKAIQLNWRNALHTYYSRHLLTSSDSELYLLIRHTALEHLKDLDTVSGYAVGFGGTPGDFYTVSLIISEPFRKETFLEMAQNSNPVIRAMALICLARHDISRHEEIVRSFYTDDAEVSYVPVGCMVGKTSLAELAKNIIDDPNMLDYWSATHTEWRSDTPSRSSREEEWIRKRIIATQLLIGKGADVNTKDKRGDTPLHYAAEHGSVRFAKLLIADGADVNARNHRGDTPLCSAVTWGYEDVVELLIASGADVNVKGRGARTPLRTAIDMNYHALSELLREKGAQK